MKKFLTEIKFTYEKNSGKTFNFDIFCSFFKSRDQKNIGQIN